MPATAMRSLLGKLLLAAAAYASSEGFAEHGYRTVINCNETAGRRYSICTCICWRGGGCSGRRADPDTSVTLTEKRRHEAGVFVAGCHSARAAAAVPGRTTITRGRPQYMG